MTPRRIIAPPPAWLVVVSAIALVAQLQHGNAGDVQQAGAELVAIGAAVVAGLVKLFGGLFGGISGQTKNALLIMRNGMVELGNKIANVAQTAGSWFKTIFDSTKKLYSRVIKPALLHLIRWIRSLQQLLGKWFGPIIKWLKVIRNDVLKFYRKILRPILDTIDIVSKLLRLLGKAGIGGATELGEKLADFGDRVEGAVLTIVRELNKAINQIDRIITLDGFLQRFTLLRSLIKFRSDVAGITLRATYKELSPTELAAYASRVKQLTLEEQIDEATELIEYDAGPLAPAVNEAAADFVRLLRAV